MERVMKIIADSALRAVMPATLLRNNVTFCPRTSVLSANGNTYLLQKNVVLVGFGKAVLGMADELYKLISDHVVNGVLSVPVGSTALLKQHSGASLMMLDEKIQIYEGATDNLPDESSYQATKEIFELCCDCGADKLIIALVSGGGSALLSYPVDGITIEEKRQAVAALANAGANIQELNSLRQTISKVKGGRLAFHALPAKMLSLIISDVVGDDVEIIASGATTLPKHASYYQLLEKFRETIVQATFPASVRSYLFSSDPKYISFFDDRIKYFVIGNNSVALQAAAVCADENGYRPIIISRSVKGNVINLSEQFVDLAIASREIRLNGSTNMLQFKNFPFDLSLDEFVSKLTAQTTEQKICLISGGEPTVLVKGNGTGGRNQELSLYFTRQCFKKNLFGDCNITFMSIGTDGQDGPTDAAGAVVNAKTWQHMLECDLKPAEALLNNDSNTLLTCFNKGNHLIKTGVTGTNVMDIQVLLIE